MTSGALYDPMAIGSITPIPATFSMPCMRSPLIMKAVFASFPHGEKTRVEILFLGGAAS